eukprot:s401_g10.t1
MQGCEKVTTSGRALLYAAAEVHLPATQREGAEQNFRTERGNLGDTTREVVVERVVVRNALSGISHQVRAYRGWQWVLRDHVRRTEWHNLDDPLISIFSTLDGARVNSDSPDEWEKAGKPMEVYGIFNIAVDGKQKSLPCVLLAGASWKLRLPSLAEVEHAPVRKAAARKPASGKIGPAAKSGSKPGLSQQTPRRPSQEIATLGFRWREPPCKCTFTADGIRVVARLLCSGRLTEVRGPALQPLEVRPGRASSNIAALAAFEEMFFIGDPEELSQGAPKSFGCVELGELTAKELSTCLAASWRAGMNSAAAAVMITARTLRYLLVLLPLVTPRSDVLPSLTFPATERSAAQGQTALAPWDELLETIFRDHKIDFVYHLAAYAAEGLSHFIRSYNYRTNLVGSAIKHHIQCFIFTSSIAVYGSINDLSQMQNPNRSLSTSGRRKQSLNSPGLHEEDRPTPEDPYGIAAWFNYRHCVLLLLLLPWLALAMVAKYAFELDLHAARELFGIDFVIFRPHNVYGPHQNMFDKYRNVVGIFINQIFHKLPMTIFGSGEQIRAFSYIDDVAPIIARGPLVPKARNEIFNVGADVPYTVNKLAAAVADAMGSPGHDVELQPARFEAEVAVSNHDKVKDYFAIASTVGLEEGSGDSVCRTVRWYREEGRLFRPVEFSSVEVIDRLPQVWRRKYERRPPEQPLPIRGLIWALRPYFIDWLQRRKRLRLFTNLVISLPDSAPSPWKLFKGGGKAPFGAFR